jgi:2,3,4,5-tetrahydropyridine-2-carboxylate N-succinyltransferase
MTSSYTSPLPDQIDELWAQRSELTPGHTEARETITGAIDQIDEGKARVAFVDPATDDVVVDERAKRSILLGFKVLDMKESQVGDFYYHDRMPLKTRFDGVRVVAGAVARWGSFLAPGVVLMPSFTNIGAYVGSGTMVDTWATVGSCAQVGENVHLSGGVLEPPQASPVIIEDEAFLGSRSMVVEGARVRKGAKLGAGTILTSSTRVFDGQTGEELPRGEAPAWSVCVTANRTKSFPGGDFGMPVLLVLKRLEEGQEHDKLALNDLLREHGVNA